MEVSKERLLETTEGANMTSLFRPWTEQVKMGNSEMQKMTIRAGGEVWLSEEKPSDEAHQEDTAADREIRYKCVKEHMKKRSEKSLFKRLKVNDEAKAEMVEAKTEPLPHWACSKPGPFCPEMSCTGFQVPNYPPSLESGLGTQSLDLLTGESPATCIVPAYGAFHQGPEFLDATLIPGLSSNLFEEYARFLTEHQKQVAERTRKQRPKKFRCPHCQVGFSNNGQLKGHIRIHTGERPFKCDAEACGKSFTRNEELTRHRRIHSGLRPFPCPECGKRFGRKDHLKKHIKTHFQQRYQLVPILSSHCSYFGYGL